MAPGTFRRCAAGARVCASLVATLLVWTTWLALALLLGVQAYVASENQMQVPGFLLRAIEAHLAESGVSVKFGKATFDPSGRVLIEKARFRLESFSEPVVTADAIYLRLDPIALLERRFEAREIRATGANLYIPAMLSASGKAETVVQDLDGAFSIASRGDEFSVDYLTFRIGGIAVSAHGQVNAGTVERAGAQATSVPLTEFLAKNYSALSREFSRAEEQLAGLEDATVHAVLTPSDTRGAIVTAELCADSLRLVAPVAVEAGQLRAHCRFPLLGGAPIMTSAVASAETLRVAGRVSADGVRVRARGPLRMETLSFAPRSIEVSAGLVTVPGLTVRAPFGVVEPGTGRSLSGSLSALLLGLPVSLKGSADLAEKSASVSFDGDFAPGLLDVAESRTGFRIRRFADLSQPVAATGEVRLDPGWKLRRIAGHVDTADLVAYHVPINEARGDAEFDGRLLRVRDGFVRSGENFVVGSYDHDMQTREFRYLISGRLRPLEISPWFRGEWWPNIFKPFGFPKSAPSATFDVQGRYMQGRHFSVFGLAEADGPVLRGVPFDSVRTILYVVPDACDGLEAHFTKAGGTADGTFRLGTEPEHGIWNSLDLDLTAKMDPTPMGVMLPGPAEASLAAFAFEEPPSISLSGHFDGPAAPDAHRRVLHAQLRAPGPLRVHGVPFERASFKLDMDGDRIDVGDVDAGFAGGQVNGSAVLEGAGGGRKLRVKASVAGASLGQSAAAAQDYIVGASQRAASAMATFARDKSGVRLDLSATAEGQPGDIASFTGEGNVQLQGAKLGELSLLGGLSKVLKFPELRFTQAKSTFKIADASLNFGDLSVIGANSAIRAKGTYSMDKRTLDFSATIYPFMESKSLLQVINAISAPISAIFRVRLTGSLEKPTWRLAYSPFNLLRVDEVRTGAAEKPPAPSPSVIPPP